MHVYKDWYGMFIKIGMGCDKSKTIIDLQNESIL